MVNENMVFKLAPTGVGSEISLSSLEWGVITQIDGVKTVKEIAGNLALTLEETYQIIASLRKKGLIFFDHQVDVKVEYVNEKVLKKITDRLMRYIGPVAQYLINDVLTELNLTADKLSKDRLPEFIELLSDEISDENKKIKFQREMLNLIKEVKK
ncbi:MAG: hypothetical protein J7L94_08800 [Caldisericaceae bacterium]|nr:hypothetical protein [Caldisericaceae bacterium]